MKIPPRTFEFIGGASVAAIAVFLNVLSARHYSRWDLTTSKRYTLAPPTVETLRALPGSIEVWVLVGSLDPLAQTIRQLLVAYRAETTKIDVHYIDPDHEGAALDDLRQRFHLDPGRSQAGRSASEAIAIVAYRDRHWFLNASDMFEVHGEGEDRVKPREERAFTSAIRAVTSAEKARLCFTEGHREFAIADPGREGLIHLQSLLEKDNYEVTSVDTTDDVREPYAGCTAVIVAGPREPFATREAEGLRTYLLSGGNAFIAAGPLATGRGMRSLGLDRVTLPFGIALVDDLVVETDATHVESSGHGLSLFAEVKPHATTSALASDDKEKKKNAPRVNLYDARSLAHAVEPGGGGAAASDLFMTSPDAYGLVKVERISAWKDVPLRSPNDHQGPLVLGMASERPKQGAAHGPRLVVVGTASVFAPRNWQEESARAGAARFVENAIGWLAAKPAVLDIPERVAIGARMNITAESLSEVRRYVLMFMPLAVALLGLALAFFRRSTEGQKSEVAPTTKPRKKKKKSA